MLQPKGPPAGRTGRQTLVLLRQIPILDFSPTGTIQFFSGRDQSGFSAAEIDLVFSPAEADPARLVLRRRVFRFGAGRPAGQALFRIVVIVVIVGKEVIIIVRIEIIFIRTREIFIFSFLFSRVSIFCQEHFSQHFLEG